MVNLRPYVVAVNHVPGCPRLESGQGGRKHGRRRCAPGCERVIDGWEVDLALRLPDGTSIRERVKAPVLGKSAALRWAQDREAHILAQGGREPRVQRGPVPTLAEFWPRFLEGHSYANREKPSSLYSKRHIYRNHLAPRFGGRRLDAIRDEDVQQLKASLRDRSVKTTNNVLSVLGKLLRVAHEWGVIERMPCRIRLLKFSLGTVEFYEPEVYEGLVEAAAKEDPRVHLVVLLGGDAGLRLGEIIGLEWPDVDFRRGLLVIRRSEWDGHVTAPKSGKERLVPMTTRVVSALQAHRHLRHPRVLLLDDGATIDRAWIYYAMKKAQRRANMVQNGRVHILRHTFCSRLAMLDVPAMSIKELAGHAHLQTTQRYLHLSSRAKGQAIRALDEAIARGGTFGDGLETGLKT
jgi:integrase